MASVSKRAVIRAKKSFARSQFAAPSNDVPRSTRFSDPSQQQVVEPGMPGVTAGPDGEECGVVAAAGFFSRPMGTHSEPTNSRR